MNVTNSSDGSLLSLFTLLSSSGTNTVQVNESLPISVTHKCTLLRVTATAVSDSYGESEPTHFDTVIFQSK